MEPIFPLPSADPDQNQANPLVRDQGHLKAALAAVKSNQKFSY